MEKYKLSDFCTIGSSKRIHLSDYVESGVPFYRSKEIIELSEHKTLSEPLFISNEKYAEIKSKFPVPQIDDILITSVGTLGKIYQVRDNFFYFKDGNLTWLRDYNKDIIDVNYLYHWLRSPAFQTQISNNNIGAVQKALTIDYLKSVDIVLPSKETQQKIAHTLSILDRKIALNQQINAKLEAMAKTLYDYWFVQFDFPNGEGKPYRSSGGEMVWCETLKRDVPMGWEVKTLSEIANITMGQSPSGDTYNEEGNGTIFFQGCTDFNWRYPTIRQYTTAPSRMAKKGDILLSVRAPVGSMNLTNFDCCIGRGLASINSKNNANSFLFYVMKYFEKDFSLRNSVGTTFGSITKDDLFSLKLLYPTNDLLNKYETIASKYNEMISKRSIENEKLTQLRDFLLPMLMNGQVGVM